MNQDMPHANNLRPGQIRHTITVGLAHPGGRFANHVHAVHECVLQHHVVVQFGALPSSRHC
jgi:hypothetical protein